MNPIRSRAASPSVLFSGFLGLLALSAVACTTETRYVTSSSGASGEMACDDECEPEAAVPASDEDDEADAPTTSGGKKKDGGAPKPSSKDGGTDAGSPPSSLGGATVAECQGTATLSVDFGGKQPKLKTGFAVYTQGHYEVYLYSRPLIDDYGYGGTSGEIKARLVIGGPTGTPNQYQGMFGVFEWSTQAGKWTNLAPPTDVTLVDIADYGVVDPTGLMCNGRLSGTVQALFSPNVAAVAAFDVPILTPSFPRSKAGPP